MDVVSLFYFMGLHLGAAVYFLLNLWLVEIKRDKFIRRLESYLDTLSPADLHEYRRFMRDQR